MKKIVFSLMIISSALIGMTQDYGTGELLRSIGDSVTTTNGTTVYIGFAKTYRAYPTPSTNDAVWKIIRTQYSTNGVFLGSQNAYGNAPGTNSWWANAWTNRVNANYK